jgi:hypothetical protein
MNIVKLTFKTWQYGKSIEVIIPETDLAAAVQEHIGQIKSGEKTTITIQPVGSMKDTYIEKKYVDRTPKSKAPVNSGSMSQPPF